MNPASELKEETYRIGVRSTILILLLIASSLFIGFTMNFSIEKKISTLLEKNLKNNKRCPINFDKFEIGTFMNSINFRNLSLSKKCTGSAPLTFSKASASIGLPSISPLGPSINTRVKDNFSTINLNSVHSFKEHAFKVSSKKLDLKTFSPFLKNVKLSGKFTIDANLLTTTKRIKKMQLRLKSTNFKLPSQTIQAFELPTLDLKNIQVKASMKSPKTLNVEEVIIGDDKSPIKANISGSIALDRRSFQSSKLDLTAEVKFSKEFIESFSILNLFLDPKKQDENGYYKLKIEGPIRAPKTPKLLDP